MQARGRSVVTSKVKGEARRENHEAQDLVVFSLHLYKIFAMLVKGKLVVKLPKPRVDALVASGDGERFDPRHDGRLMKEWLSVEPTSEEEWLPLAREAMEFVTSKR